MPIVSTYSVSGPSSSITLSQEYSTLDELIIQLPENTDNLITPSDIRDSVYTMWQRVEDAKAIALSASTPGYINPYPTTVSVGGVPRGTSFPTEIPITDLIDKILYPYVPATASILIQGGVTIREYGNPVGLAPNSITLEGRVDQITSGSVDADAIINLITLNGTVVFNTPDPPPFLYNYFYSQTTNGTHSWNTSNVSETQVFYLTCQDDGLTTVTASTTLTWMNKIYWGRINLSSIGNPNLTINPGSASLVSTLCTDTLIRNLTGAGFGTGNELSTTKSKSYTAINGAGQYLIFAWPSSVADSLTPKFIAQGIPSTAFTRVRTVSQFTNIYGFKTNYEVWVSNTIQNGAINITIT